VHSGACRVDGLYVQSCSLNAVKGADASTVADYSTHYSGFVLLFLDSPDYSLKGSVLSFCGIDLQASGIIGLTRAAGKKSVTRCHSSSLPQPSRMSPVHAQKESQCSLPKSIRFGALLPAPQVN
jgi:hypothetical protein